MSVQSLHVCIKTIFQIWQKYAPAHPPVEVQAQVLSMPVAKITTKDEKSSGNVRPETELSQALAL